MALSNYHIYGSFDKEKRRKIAKRVVKELKNVEFDALAVRGVSGLIMAPIIAYLLNKHVIVVRKPKSEEHSHANVLVESPIDSGTYIVFDDFVSCGTTAHTIMNEIKKHLPKMKCVGGYCWAPARTFEHHSFTEEGVISLNKGGKDL